MGSKLPVMALRNLGFTQHPQQLSESNDDTTDKTMGWVPGDVTGEKPA